jgi:MFS family permease
MTDRTWRTVAMLGTAQTLAFASTYYLPAMLAAPMSRDLGVSTPLVFAAFSLAMLVSAPLGPLAGRAIDRHGGHVVLPITSVTFAAGLAALSLAQGALSLFAAWFLIGLGMGGGLYEAAFSTLVRLYGTRSRSAITGITLVAGFASTAGWPLSAWMEAHWGWRGACAGWATLHLLLGLPLNACLPRRPLAAGHAQKPTDGETGHEIPQDPLRAAPGTPLPVAGTRTAVALATVFAIAWFISTAMATHLPQLLQVAGLSLAAAVSVGALVGPAQVAGRLAEFGLLRHLHPLLSARLAAVAHPLGALGLLLASAPLLGTVAPVFVLLHGAGNGILTIAKGTLPLALFGPVGYGARLGLVMTPARFTQALAPPVFGLALERWGAGALWITAALGGLAFSILLALRCRQAVD